MKQRGGARPCWAFAALSLTALACNCAALRTAPSAAGRSCPTGARPDLPRLTALHDLLQRDAEAAQLVRQWPLLVCFGSERESGVISGDVALLAASGSDRELAPRLAHLLIHRRDQLGDGCAVGLAVAQRSEDHAAALESRLRQLLGAPPLTTQSAARLDYLRRCRRP